jgi:cobalt-zinc-cadmium resistance protein CzcA
MSALFLKKHIREHRSFSDRIVSLLRRAYRPALSKAIRKPLTTVLASAVVFLFSLILFSSLGAEFVPTLEEGDIAMQQSIKPGSSLNESIHTTSMAEKILIKEFPEVLHVVSKIGTAEVPTDPMAIEDADVMIIMKDKDEWTSATTREEMMRKMKRALDRISWASFEFTQPIQLRFNELMTGSKSDISIKIFGEDVAVLKSKADEAAELIRPLDGAGDVKVDQTDGLQQLSIQYDRDRLAQHGVTVEDINQTVRAAYAGEVVGRVFEEERSFDLVVRLAPDHRQELNLSALSVNTQSGQSIPLQQLAEVAQLEGPMLISREQARRFINIGVNLRNRDVASLVADIEDRLNSSLNLPPGYDIQYGGAFQNLQHATDRLLIAVPIALALILLLLYLAFGSIKDTVIIFMAVPLSAVGGIVALWLRDMPFSISSGIGFIALFGVSVLNGIVLLSAIKQLQQNDFKSLNDLVGSACISRLRPVLMTAAVAALGFLPMALSTGSGAEVQRPLATVVIGGLISSTMLTLLVLPALYLLFYRKKWNVPIIISVCLLLPAYSGAQDLDNYADLESTAVQQHPILRNQAMAHESAALNGNAKVRWGTTDILLQQGQINYEGNDHQLQILQDVSPLIRFQERARQQAHVQAQLAALDLDQAMELNKWKSDLRSSYSEWQYRQALWILHQGMISAYDKLEPKVQLRYEAGAMDVIEYGLFMNDLAAFKQRSSLIGQHAISAEKLLRSRAFLNDTIRLIFNNYDPIADSVQSFFAAESILLKRLEEEVSVVDTRTKVENTRARQAAVSAGYFNQTLEGVTSFDGFLIGLNIPLDNRVNNIRKKQGQLQIQTLENQIEEQRRMYNARVASLRAELMMLKESIRVYTDTLLPRQRSIREKSLLQFEKGEIDYMRLSQIQEHLTKQQEAYLTLIRKHDELAISLIYSTEQTP